MKLSAADAAAAEAGGVGGAKGMALLRYRLEWPTSPHSDEVIVYHQDKVIDTVRMKG